MMNREVVEEKFKFLFDEEYNVFFNLKDLILSYDLDKGVLDSYQITCHLESKGIPAGEVWSITQALDTITKRLTTFFQKYKLLDSGKISLKPSKDYNIDDIFFREVHYNFEDNFEVWAVISIYIENYDNR